MLKKATNFFVDLDDFGHPVTLNFNEQGETYKTCLGAFSSVVMKVFLIFVLYIKFNVFLSKSNNSIGFEIHATDSDELGAIDLNNQEVLPFFSLLKNGQALSGAPGQEIHRYLSFVQGVLEVSDKG